MRKFFSFQKIIKITKKYTIIHTHSQKNIKIIRNSKYGKRSEEKKNVLQFLNVDFLQEFVILFP
jgi:hypothetical protein